MTRAESVYLRVYNPHIDDYVDYVSDVNLHFNEARVLDDVEVVSIITEKGVKLHEYMKAEHIAEAEQYHFDHFYD